MEEALEEARKATNYGELPIAAVVVAGQGDKEKEVARSQTRAKREGTRTAHAELTALAKAGNQLVTAPDPIVVYSTLEPCLMCLGAAMRCQVGEMIYALPCQHDGSSQFVSQFDREGYDFPQLSRADPELEKRALNLMRQFAKKNPQHPAIDYVKKVIAGMEEENE